ncbi:DNA alkylation repair protein [Paenibacillus sp. GCM10023252]|uniref:DNA alkylation repair protein n=1 Tax=Paenibacillus sp. GCM10023252 TaxID=3252649 RepID=UPI003621441B
MTNKAARNEVMLHIRPAFEHHRDPHAAAAMEAYMRNQFPFLGIKAPKRREIQKELLKEHTPTPAWIQLLWELPEREYAVFATDLLIKLRKKLGPEHMGLIEYCITTKSWWDTVDAIASHVVGYMFANFPNLREEYAEKWICSDNLWLNRTVILHQLSYKQKTDEVRLYESILIHAGSLEFFHQKAIGWALREYAKTNPDSVLSFVREYEKVLKPLSRREALKHLIHREESDRRQQ